MVVVRRTWPFLLLATLAVWPGVALSGSWDSDVLTGLLGGLLIALRRTDPAGAEDPTWE